MAPFKPRTDLQIGGWRLIRRLGQGGNAEVWKAECDGKVVALKMLRDEHTERSEPYQRFIQEVTLLRQLAFSPGVLPLLDADLPTRSDANTPAWYAMPVAVPLQDHLIDLITLEEIVTVVLAFARTLARLHSESIYHRDLKPPNLFRLDEEYVIGDFGIASFPGKPELTERGRKLGPLHFHAPELLHSADTAAGGPVDVYSLAKTLWVLAAGQTYPPPGELRIDVPALRVSTWVEHPRVRLLDATIERSTRHDPTSRSSMADLAAELEAWINPKTHVDAMNDYSDLLREIAFLTEAERRARNLEQEREKLVNQVAGIILERLKPIEEGYQDMRLMVVNRANYEESIRCFARELAPYPSEDVQFQREAVVQAGGGGCGIRSGISLRMTRSDELLLVGAHLFFPPGAGATREVLWSDVRHFPLGGAQQENAINELSQGLTDHFGAMVIRIRDFLSDARS